MIGEVLVLLCWAACLFIDRFQPYPASHAALWAVFEGVCAVISVRTGQPTMVSLTVAGFSGWFAYLAWKRRKPRQRRPSKIAAKVKDLGHRLTVVPT